MMGTRKKKTLLSYRSSKGWLRANNTQIIDKIEEEYEEEEEEEC